MRHPTAQVFNQCVRRPAVLVVAIPHVCASALAFYLRQAETFDVFAPDVAGGEGIPMRRFDAVLTTVPVPEAEGDMVIELPQSFDRPVTVSVRDLRFAVNVSETHPIEDVAGLLRRYFFQDEQPAPA